jgi:hypothetical protein
MCHCIFIHMDKNIFGNEIIHLSYIISKRKENERPL